jgi:hypothetical protein
MTEIVRASLGLPTLRAGPQFQNPKPLHLLIKVSQMCFGHWNLEFICNLVLGICDLRCWMLRNDSPFTVHHLLLTPISILQQAIELV